MNELSASIAYRYHDNLYLNITNRCPCDCQFCLRNDKAAVGEAQTLWLEHEPSADEVIEALRAWDLRYFREIVYCGYGEPFSAYEVMMQTARWIKDCPDQLKVRLNTNGLGDLIVGRPTAPDLAGLFDAVSVSLNAPTPKAYEALCRPVFGLDALPHILSFTRQVKEYVPEVVLSVVDLLSPEDLAACEAIAADMGVPLRVRRFV
ncbi:MAG: TatD family nuclease-associated radical SAM protein [Actinomycetes bacterium]|nr:TatD family nuclease-associated radical SAM protein [Actinomycetes bacterium]